MAFAPPVLEPPLQRAGRVHSQEEMWRQILAAPWRYHEESIMWAQCGLRRAASKDVDAVGKNPYDNDDNNGDCHMDGDKIGDCYGYDSHGLR
eukprot:7680521-Pyramimonas_sp.AAC.1